MATNENKVQFNIKNVHYAVMTADGETPTWENPVPVPGRRESVARGERRDHAVLRGRRCVLQIQFKQRLRGRPRNGAIYRQDAAGCLGIRAQRHRQNDH